MIVTQSSHFRGNNFAIVEAELGVIALTITVDRERLTSSMGDAVKEWLDSKIEWLFSFLSIPGNLGIEIPGLESLSTRLSSGAATLMSPITSGIRWLVDQAMSLFGISNAPATTDSPAPAPSNSGGDSPAPAPNQPAVEPPAPTPAGTPDPANRNRGTGR